jgi:hypothetical protein
MAQPWDKKDFSRWERALAAGHLTEDQIATLDTMMKGGEAESR